MTNNTAIIDLWLTVELDIPGRRKTDALHDLNAALGGRYQLQRLNDWRHGRRPIPRPVHEYMLEIALESLLGQYSIDAHHLSDRQWQSLAATLA